jgi:hypothetical protein
MGRTSTQPMTRKWLCTECRKRLGLVPHKVTQTLPVTFMRGVCDECEAKFVPVSLYD